MAKRAGKRNGPKILIFDIETAPYTFSAWSPKQDYIGHHQMREDRCVLAWAAKWLGDPPSKMIYADQRERKDMRNDKALLKKLHPLLEEADVVVTKNGKRFDQPVVFGRMAVNDISPPMPFRHEDVESLFRKHFALPYYNMDYLSQVFCKKYKKGRHKKFSGHELWDECLARNPAAWAEMEKYNRLDVLVTEELLEVISPWGTSVDLNPMRPGEVFRCQCGSDNLQKRGFRWTKTSKFQQYQCMDCRGWITESGAANNLLSSKKRKSLRER